MLSDIGIAPREVIVLEPTQNETVARLGTAHKTLVNAARARIPFAGFVRSMTSPPEIRQLLLPLGTRAR
jgi:hypothetical protein